MKKYTFEWLMDHWRNRKIRKLLESNENIPEPMEFNERDSKSKVYCYK
jgi:hypothetical protein